MRVVRGIFWCATILLAGSVVGLFALSSQDLRFAAPQLERALSQHLKHDISIKGPVRAALIPEGLRLSLGDVSVRNVDWGLEPSAGKADRFTVDVKLWPLLQNKVELDRFRLSGATLYVERHKSGQVNWSALTGAADRIDIVQQAQFDDVQIQFYDLTQGGMTRLAVRRLSITPSDNRIHYKGRLQIAGQPIEFSGHLDDLNNWADEKPARSQSTIRLAGLRFDVRGLLSDPRVEASNLQVVSKLPSDSILSRVFSLADGRADLSAELRVSDGRLVLDDMTIGADDEGPFGTLSLDWRPFEKPLFDAYGFAATVTLDDEALSALSAQADPMSWVPAVARIVENWNGRVELQAGQMTISETQLDDVLFRATALDGRLSDGSLETLVASGHAEMPFQASLDPIVSISAQPRLTNVRLEQIQNANGAALPFGGLLNLAADLRGEGNTFDEILGSLQGQSNLLLGDGLIVSSADFNLGTNSWSEIWQLFSYGRWNRDEPSSDMELSCVVSRFDFGDGMATANGFLVETNEAATTGAGFVDLKDGRIDFRLSPRPKDPSLLAKAADLRVAGHLARPVLTRQRDTATDRRGAGVVGTLVLSGGAQTLLPLMDISHDNENVCVRRIAGSVSDVAPLRRRNSTGNGG